MGQLPIIKIYLFFFFYYFARDTGKKSDELGRGLTAALVLNPALRMSKKYDGVCKI